MTMTWRLKPREPKDPQASSDWIKRNLGKPTRVLSSWAPWASWTKRRLWLAQVKFRPTLHMGRRCFILNGGSHSEAIGKHDRLSGSSGEPLGMVAITLANSTCGGWAYLLQKSEAYKLLAQTELLALKLLRQGFHVVFRPLVCCEKSWPLGCELKSRPTSSDILNS